MASITYYSLSDYNNSILTPFTIENVEVQTYEEHLEEINENLERISEERDDGELREEWIVCDYEDIPSRFVGEWSIDSEYFEMCEAMNSSHLDEEAFMAGVELGIPYERIEDAYYGEYQTDEEFAESVLENSGEQLSDNLMFYFDYERYARDLLINDFDVEDGHYFYSNY